MARKNVEEQETIENEDTLDDLPDDDEMDDEVIEEEVLSQDEIDEMGFNEEEDEADRALLNPPTGVWQKTGRWTYTKLVNSDDCQDGDLDSGGRTIYQFVGKLDKREEKGVVYEPTIVVRMSPDKRVKDNKPDFMRKMFVQAKDVFLEEHGRQPKNQKELRLFIENGSFAVRTWNPSGGIAASDILPIKKKK